MTNVQDGVELRARSGEYRFGSWRIWYDPPPIPTRDCDWHYQDDDEETRCGHCPSLQACLDEIAERIEDEAALSVPPVNEGEIERIAAAIWRETYRHDTLLNWSEIKPGTMHHQRVIAAARAVLTTLKEQG